MAAGGLLAGLSSCEPQPTACHPNQHHSPAAGVGAAAFQRACFLAHPPIPTPATPPLSAPRRPGVLPDEGEEVHHDGGASEPRHKSGRHKATVAREEGCASGRLQQRRGGQSWFEGWNRGTTQRVKAASRRQPVM